MLLYFWFKCRLREENVFEENPEYALMALLFLMDSATITDKMEHQKKQLAFCV